MMMMIMIMTWITCQMMSSRGGIPPPPLSPLIKGHLKYPKPCYILKVLLGNQLKKPKLIIHTTNLV